MRVLLAALFVFGGILLAVCLLSKMMEHLSHWIILLLAPALAALFLLLCAVALVLFNSIPEKPMPSVDIAQQLQEWEEQRLLTTTNYHAMRAFEVEESEDEGRHIFLELQDGSVLYLSGQYLYEYGYDEENEDETPIFPCTDFTVKRHQDGWVVVDLLCQGQPLDSDETLPDTFWDCRYWIDHFPGDGDIITDQTYDQLRSMD